MPKSIVLLLDSCSHFLLRFFRACLSFTVSLFLSLSPSFTHIASLLSLPFLSHTLYVDFSLLFFNLSPSCLPSSASPSVLNALILVSYYFFAIWQFDLIIDEHNLENGCNLIASHFQCNSYHLRIFCVTCVCVCLCVCLKCWERLWQRTDIYTVFKHVRNIQWQDTPSKWKIKKTKPKWNKWAPPPPHFWAGDMCVADFFHCTVVASTWTKTPNDIYFIYREINKINWLIWWLKRDRRKRMGKLWFLW